MPLAQHEEREATVDRHEAWVGPGLKRGAETLREHLAVPVAQGAAGGGRRLRAGR